MQGDVFRGPMWVCRAGIIVRAWESMISFVLRGFESEVFVIKFIKPRTVQVWTGAVEVEVNGEILERLHRNSRMRR